MSNSRSFVDTNILVYAKNSSFASKHAIALELLDELWRTKTGVISTQVLIEFHNVVTRKFRPPLSPADARVAIERFGEWPVIQTDVALILRASSLHQRHQISFWDALIVEAARRGGAAILLSEDLQAGRTIEGVRIVNPFGDL